LRKLVVVNVASETGTSAVSGQRNSKPNREALLNCAIDLIEASGEQGVRVEEVARLAGTPVTAIYHSFGSRAELIEAAQRVRFERLWARTTSRDVAALARLVDETPDLDTFERISLSMVDSILGDERADERLLQLQLLGSAMFNEGARSAMATLYHDGLHSSTTIFETAGRRSLQRIELEPLHAAAWAYLNQFSRVFNDLDTMLPYTDAVNAIRRDAIRWLMDLEFTSQQHWSTGLETGVNADDIVLTDDDTPLHPTAERLIDEVIEHLRRSGELRLRLRAVARDQRVSESLIHRHFGSREQLLARAHGERFRRSSSAALSDLATVVGHCASHAEFLTALRVVIRSEVGQRNRPVRLERLNVYGATEARPALLEQVSKILVTESSDVADGLEVAQDRGWIAPAVDVLAVGMWLVSLIDSQVCFELNERSELDDEIWAATINRFLERLLMPT
jgi:AcrR family transcriptional regulator